MTDTEKYLFDVHGYLVIEGALSPQEVAAANAAVDHHADAISIRPNDLANGSTTLRGTTGRGDLGGMLTWDKPHCDVFRQMIAHPRLMPYLEELLGSGPRLDLAPDWKDSVLSRWTKGRKVSGSTKVPNLLIVPAVSSIVTVACIVA